MKIKTLKSIKNLKNKRVLLRVDFNVPIKNNKIEDDSRIKKTLPTIKYLQKHKAKIIIVSHLGRPKGKFEKSLTLKPIKASLEKLLKTPIYYEENFDFKKLEVKTKLLKEKEILILENIRFLKEEKENSKKLAKNLAKLGDIFVNDAFAAAHRAHSSTEKITYYLKSYAGFLMEKEIKELSKLTEGKPKKPITIIFGGAKVDTKIGVIKNFLHKADNILLGGALANTFLKANGTNVEKSLVENNKIDTAKKILDKFKKEEKNLVLPEDCIVVEEIDEKAKTLNVTTKKIPSKSKIVDIGKISIKNFTQIIKESKTIILNGPMGIYEFKNMAKGTKKILKAIKENKGKTILGGGDTIDAVKKLKFKEKDFSYISSGGGASIEFLEGKTLPAIKPLLKN